MNGRTDFRLFRAGTNGSLSYSFGGVRMFCPRCGSQNPDSTKFCRQCGLPLAQLTGYVTSGGTGTLATPPPPMTPTQPTTPIPAQHIANLTEGMTPKQKMVLAILCFVFAVPLLNMLGLEPLAKIASVLMAPGILWSIFHFKAQARRLEQQQMQMQIQMQMPPYQAPYQVPYQALPQPQQPPVQPPVYYPAQQPMPQPVYQPPVAPPPSNPLGDTRGSVTEEDTRRLSG